MRPNPKTVELVSSKYQPTKAEEGEKFDFKNLGDTVEGRMGILGHALAGTVNIRQATIPGSASPTGSFVYDCPPFRRLH